MCLPYSIVFCSVFSQSLNIVSFFIVLICADCWDSANAKTFKSWEVGGNAKTFEFGRLKVDKKFLYASLQVVYGNLGYWLPNARNIFDKFIFCWVHELKIQKWRFFGIASELREKSKNVGLVWGQYRKLLYNQFALDFTFVYDCFGWKTFICIQANVFWHLCTKSGKWMDVIFYFTGTTAQARYW